MNRRVFLLEAKRAETPDERRREVEDFVNAVLAGADFLDGEDARQFLRASTQTLTLSSASARDP